MLVFVYIYLSMRKFSSILVILIAFWVLFLGALSPVFAGDSCWFNFSDDNCGYSTPPYCTDGNCTLSGWLTATQTALGGSITNKPLSEYIVDIVRYFLGFVSLIAVIYVIYAGFQVMTGAGDDEKTKKAKKIILFVIVGIVIMWLAYAIVSWTITTVSRSAHLPPRDAYTWSFIPEVSAAYTENDADTFREYQNKLRIAIQDLENELRINKKVNTGNLQNIKNLVQAAFDRLPDFGDAGTQNDTMKRAVDRDIELAIKNPSSTSQVGNAISSIASFISSANIESVQWGINATPGEGNAPVTVSFQATGVKDPSGTTPDQMNYIWWIRENWGTRKELGRGKSLVYTFTQEWSYTVFLDVISGSRNSKNKIDVLPLTVSKVIDVKPRLGEIVLLVNGVNVSNLTSLKINPNIGKMGIIFDATASRATGGNISETTWDFGNNNTQSYQWAPTVERQIFSNDGDYNVKLTLNTNNGQVFTKNLRLIVRNPSAVIAGDTVSWNIGDDMYFSSISYFTNSTNVEYSWQIQDDNNKKILSNLPGSTLKYKFDRIGSYIVTLTARSPNGEIDTDSRQITIESRVPVVNLEAPKPESTESPNILVFDASKSYDPDIMGRKGLTYTWRIDGNKVTLDNTSNEWAKWTLKFDSVGTHTVSLTVSNAYGKVTTVDRQFEVKSILSANILISPRVAPLGTIVNFIAQSENADFYEWNMGDGSPVSSGNKKIQQHIYKKTGIYDVVLTVSSANGNQSNQIRRRVFVTDTGAPYALINISNGSNTAYYDPEACGSGATIVNRSEATTFDASKSINVDGGTSDLTYTWTYFGKVKTLATLSEKLNEIGCYPIKLTVRSNKTGTSHTTTEYLYIKNLPPEVTSISTSIDTTKKDSQKVLVKVNANGASDPDGVITSYIWFYTTESDKEPQNIQITQKPEITFVLPNITEKYYFWVILEDNDGAKTNSINDGSEQVPLILDNQNGNIYMPLITLTTPKNAVLVGENVYFSAEAKTIVWTNITKNAEYAWDFDGDGRFDERSTNPSINYTFKNSGTYSIKVRVTYNGVSNTKYATVYVKNPLKASAQWYELADGSLYFMNTSEWLFNDTSWTFLWEQTQSPYTLIIPRTIADTLTGDILGTIRVSNGDTDTSIANLERSTLKNIASQSGITYQSSPLAIDDTIHIAGQWDKLMLSFLGNTATTYSIDTDTRIDSDLDGIPDNDIDNKWHSSYTDGTLYVISDFAENRTRERIIRIEMVQDGITIGSKNLRLILDFIPESLATDEELSLWSSESMSSFERSKLEELASMIRETESADRVILMKEYNIMVENWDDSFSKAKSLIDIQETVDTTALSEDKKITMSAIIDALLVGDAVSVDEVTLASKLIQDLIPIDSPNRVTILEKLSAISSHPSDIETNKKLGTEILELVKNDASIEDKYKLHIRNQLLIIINGGQASIPSGEVESTESSGSGLLGFFSWVAMVFFWIIGWIILVLLMGYVFYLLSRKNDDIGFQDFLIDSVFHSKKIETPHDMSSSDEENIIIKAPIIQNETIEKKTQQEDPLASYTPASVVWNPTVIAPLNEIQNPTSETTAIPSWLQAPIAEEVWTTDPLSTIANMNSEIEEKGTQLTNNNTTDTDILTDKVQIPTESWESPLVSETSDPLDMHSEVSDEVVPDWLKSSMIESTPKEELTEKNHEVWVSPDISENMEDSQEWSVSSEEKLPDWLVDSLKNSNEDDPWILEAPEEIIPVETSIPKKTKKTPKIKDPAPVPNASDIPDWLK